MLVSTKGLCLIIWMAVFTSIITLSLVLRIAAARIKKRDVRVDDWTICAAYVNSLCYFEDDRLSKAQVSTLALQGTVGWAIANGLGAHTLELSKYEVGAQYKVILGTKRKTFWAENSLLTNFRHSRHRNRMGRCISSLQDFHPVVLHAYLHHQKFYDSRTNLDASLRRLRHFVPCRLPDGLPSSLIPMEPGSWWIL